MSYGDKSMLSPPIIAFIYVLALSAVVFAEVVLSPSSPGVIENSSLTLTCTYTGDETVTSFTWKRVKTNESNFAILGTINAECKPLIIPVDTSLYEYSCPRSKQYTWTIKKVTKQNEGDKYQCVVETLLPKLINSNSVVIYIQVKVANVTLKDGSTILAGILEVTNSVRKTLTCTASESRPTAVISWYIGNEVKKKENVTLSTLTFTPVNSDHNKHVYCKASQTGNPDVFSYKIPLYVKELATTPTITDLTSEKLEGDQIRYQCTSSQTRPVAIVTWKLQTLTLTIVHNTEQSHGNDLKSVTSIVTFTANRMDNNKTIYCETAIPGQSVVKAQEKMTVYWPPSQPRIKNDSFPFLEGQTGKSIYCSTSDYGNPTATATWSKKYGTPDVADTRKLKLPKLTYQIDRSPVSCQLKNLFTQKKGLQIQSIQVLLQVEYSPIIQILVDSKQVNTTTKDEGQTLSATCNASGNPNPNVDWVGQPSRGPTLLFDDIDRTDHGKYTCRATATSTHYPSHNFIKEDELNVTVNCKLF
ncbi:cell surface glycoprotein MUC18-like [Ruditapes philippinarum]|uniref:cell surface glycoprotein MUC18-like n=1 Tax=Ruditapes philippinarum TaxID=129788 RepID=UPI00295BEE43|nr:cell surface glycoprotein MUC18-like [Ruditapes philippinarum]